MREGLYAIVDLPHPAGLPVAAYTRAVLGDRLDGGDAGASVVQLRAKHATTAQRIAWLAEMVPACRAAGVPLLVNDDLEAALDGDADGLHLGQTDPGADDLAVVRAAAASRGRTLSVGLSTHDLGQLRAACRRTPDYVALGPIAPTRTKADPDPVVGFSKLLDGCRIASRPLVAIGGMDEERGRRAIELGATAVAVIGALVHADATETRDRAIALSRAFAAAAAPLSIDEVHARIPVLDRDQLSELARWGDALSIHIGLGLPARFAPWVEDGRPWYRPRDVLDLLMALGKHPGESWEAWRARSPDDGGPLIQLRRH